MKNNRTIFCFILIFIISITANYTGIAKEIGSMTSIDEDISIRVIDYSTYLCDMETFKERTKCIDNNTINTDEIIVLSPEEVEYRTLLYQSQRDKDNTKTRLYYGVGYVQGQYYYELSHYDPDTAYPCYCYQYLGYVRMVNPFQEAQQLTYTQQTTVTAQSSLSLTCTISASAKASMFQFAELEVGVAVAEEATVTAGTSFSQVAGGTIIVPGYQTRRITAYYDGVYVGGTAYYDIYDESNGVPGQLIEVDDPRPASDQVIAINAYTLILSSD